MRRDDVDSEGEHQGSVSSICLGYGHDRLFHFARLLRHQLRQEILNRRDNIHQTLIVVLCRMVEVPLLPAACPAIPILALDFNDLLGGR